MDLLGSNPVFSLRDRDFRIFSRNESRPPHRMGENARVINSLVTEGCDIEGVVQNSVLSSGVKVEKGAFIKDSVILSDVVIGEGSTVNYSIIDSDTVIGKGCVIGKTKSDTTKVAVVAGGIDIPNGTVIPDGAMADKDYIENIVVKEEV